MQLIKKRGLFEASRVVYLPIGELTLNPGTPRRDSPPGTMRELAASIAKYGVLQPLSVRRAGGGYELISGERRLRGAMLAGLREVPCIIMDVGEQESAALVLVENLQRRDLDFIEEARALARLRGLYGYSQEETARLVGRSQSAVANKLRLLKLPPQLLCELRDAGLTERHARALLRLEGEGDMTSVLAEMIRQDMNVARAEEYVEDLLSGAPGNAAQKPSIVVRDVRFFLNTVERGAALMRQNGVNVTVDTAETEKSVVITVKVRREL